jgi:hypothetical protein
MEAKFNVRVTRAIMDMVETDLQTMQMRKGTENTSSAIASSRWISSFLFLSLRLLWNGGG